MKGYLDDLNDSINVTIYRIIQESLTNVAKYAEADNVPILLHHDVSKSEGSPEEDVDFLFLNIEDSGKGMDLFKSVKGFRLADMRERILAAGGEFM